MAVKEMESCMKPRVLLAIGLACLMTSVAWAQQSAAASAPATDAPATKDDILKLFRVMDTQDQMRQVMQQVIGQMAQMNRDELKKRRSGVTDDDLAEMDKEFKEVAKSYPVDQLMEDMVPVYQKHLSKADVDAMIAFYSSPTGKKLLHEMPAMTAEGIQAAYPRMQKNLDAILKRMGTSESRDKDKDKADPGQKPAVVQQ
jgi:hypothetical protein